jgi:hypothetical protein
VLCRTKGAGRATDLEGVSDQTLHTPAEQAEPLGPRLVGLALLCVTLFTLATLVGLLANSYA